jgi:hypothetical protein
MWGCTSLFWSIPFTANLCVSVKAGYKDVYLVSYNGARHLGLAIQLP